MPATWRADGEVIASSDTDAHSWESSLVKSGKEDRAYCYGFAIVVGDWCHRLNRCSSRFLRETGLSCTQFPALSRPTDELPGLVDKYLTERQMLIGTE